MPRLLYFKQYFSSSQVIKLANANIFLSTTCSCGKDGEKILAIYHTWELDKEHTLW
jgi:hypothetical protein